MRAPGRHAGRTYLDVPFHRFADGHDLTELPLERVAEVAYGVVPSA